MKTIDQVIELNRPLIGIDLETTGVVAKTSSIVQLALEIMKPGEPTKEYKTLVNPVQPIPPASTAIHGITNEHVKDAPTFKQLASNLYSGLRDCDFIGYNVRFDLAQLQEEFIRAGYDWNYEGARILDGYRLWQVLEDRTLASAVKRWLGREGDIVVGEGQAHDALWDLVWSTRVVAGQVLLGHLSVDLDELHKLQWADWYDNEGKLRWNDNKLCFSFGQHRNVPIDQVPRQYLSGFILKKDFSAKVKHAAEMTLKGLTIVRG